MNRELLIAWIAVSLVAVGGGILAQAEEPATGPAADRPDQESPAAEPAVQAWVQTLVRRIADSHPGIRKSAREGLVALGRPALPALRQHALSADPEVAAAAKELIRRIERGGRGARRQGEGAREPRGEGPRQRQGGGVPRLLADLGLDEEQKSKIKELLERGARKRRELFQDMRDGALPREEMRAALRDLQAESMKSLESLLTEEQLAKYRKAAQERGPRGEGRRRPERRGPKKDDP